MSLKEKLFGLAGYGTPLRRDDRGAWEAATSLADLGGLMALWLAGELDSRPGYYGPVDVDERYAPGLTTTLIALNQAGFVTDQSQAGHSGPGYNGAHWEQLAAVAGYADDDTFNWLTGVIRGTRFEITGHRAASRSSRFRFANPSSPTFGDPISVSEVEFSFEGAGPEAIEALCAAWQVAIYDPQVGSNDLWPYLRSVL